MIFEVFGKLDCIEEFNVIFNDVGFWVVLGVGIMLFLYKVIMIMLGWIGMLIMIFFVIFIVVCGLWFFIVVVLLWKFGVLVCDFIECCLSFVFIVFFVFLIGGFFVLRFL